MEAMVKGTRRSSFPTACSVNETRHSHKLRRFIEIGYEVVSENGYTTILAYYPCSSSYVKIVTVENGKITSSLKLTPKQLRVLSERVGMKFSTNKGLNMTKAIETTELPQPKEG